MAENIATQHKRLVTKISNALKKKSLSKTKLALLQKFIQQYLCMVSIEDLKSRSAEEWAGAVLCHWQGIYKRSPGDSKIRIYNPSLEKDGWECENTVVDILHDDMPFLVDSLHMAINRQDYTTLLVVHMGGMKLARDKKHHITDVLPLTASVTPGVLHEAPIHFEIDRIESAKAMEELELELARTLDDVHTAVTDWRDMRDRLQDAILELESVTCSHLDPLEIQEAIDFLHWLDNHHFTLLGCRDYHLFCKKGEESIRRVPSSGLGVLREVPGKKSQRSFATLTPEARRLMLSPQVLIVAKTNTMSTVHRPVYTDYIGVKSFNVKGKPVGERRFIGLFTSSAYHANPEDIPFLRRKVLMVIRDSKLPENSHAGKVLLGILRNLPRDDLFQTSPEELLELAIGILHLQDRKIIRLFARKDIYGRFVSCLVFVPRELFNTQLRKKMQKVLMSAIGGTEVSFVPMILPDSSLVRIDFLIRIDAGTAHDFDVDAIEQQLIEVGRTWEESLQQELCRKFKSLEAQRLFAEYGNAFPVSYKDNFSPYSAVFDVEHLAELSDKKPLTLSFYKEPNSNDCHYRFKIFRLGIPIIISDVLPMMEDLGLRVINEWPYELVAKSGEVIWVHDFRVQSTYDSSDEHIEEIRDGFKEAFTRAWYGDAETDSFNHLVISAKLNWREVSVLRAYAKYLTQTGFIFSQAYVESALVNNPDIVEKILGLFSLRFMPQQKGNTAVAFAGLEAKIHKALDLVANLDEDRILRRYLDLIHGTIRTNFYQVNEAGEYKPYISFKFDPKKIPELPLPLPCYEIFVYSPRFEGVHLRGGRVARGGLRWSDRREDFRTEVLGLMKAQQVKNSVIVPLGAKGGFVPKCLPSNGSREEVMTEVVGCYKQFISGLLDITDNYEGSKVIPPQDVVRYDDDDPYLVVAADKGTATFSDIANGVALDYGFWLGDAFASGGSVGYDHKKMGITAKGAWESVKRHFRGLNIDTQTMPFTVIGIGDMSGDVFGNGMLLSKHIKLVAAFNHMHIFIDPNPEVKSSYRERQRMFKLARSSWADYNRDLISKGGGIFERSAKSITVTPEMQELLGVKKKVVVPTELIRLLLKAPVDLLWNGGIGTYVKATQESNADAGDRANDGVRINGAELRCRVVGEGGNLGLTQLGRVEYALNGGTIFTDFIDNSAGVDCSDHEVNIKILLNEIVRAKKLNDKQRANLLMDMTDAVSKLTLYNNYRQTQAINLALFEAPENLELHRRFINDLELQGKIDRAIEFLPDEHELTMRKSEGKGLVAPELAVLLAYSKNLLKQEILASGLTQDKYLSQRMAFGFPAVLREKYWSYMQSHRLRNEIVATETANTMINEMGITFIPQLQDETGAPIDAIVRGYVVSRELFGIEQLWKDIQATDGTVGHGFQVRMMKLSRRLIRRATRWLIRNRPIDFDITHTIKQFSQPVAELEKDIVNVIGGIELEHLEQTVADLVKADVPEKLAKRIGRLGPLFSVLDIIEAASRRKQTLSEVAKVYYAIGERLELSWFRDQIICHPVIDHWDALARASYRDNLDWLQRCLTVDILAYKTRATKVDERIDAWLSERPSLVNRWRFVVAELRSSTSIKFMMFSVALSELQDLAQMKGCVIKPKKAREKVN